jgi:hypothetical protein
MQEFAYRFIPTGEDGKPRQDSQLFMVTNDSLEVGSVIDADLPGYTTWEVVQVRPGQAPGDRCFDRLGNEIPMVATLICKGFSQHPH